MTDIKHSAIKSTDLYNEGAKVQTKNHNALESTKLGNLRGGSAGALVDGKVYGKCHRLSLARFKGISTPKNEGAQYWFDAGYANEEAWDAKLTAFLQENPDYSIKSEEDCPIKWHTSNGTAVTGRPDFVIFKNDTALLGLELKVVCTINSAIDKWAKNKPATANLIQAAHYSLIMGIPYNLVYSFRSRGPAPYWAVKQLKGTGTLNHKNEIEPFTCEFRLGFENDLLYYIDRFGLTTQTKITGQSIRDYYELIVDMDDKKDLYNRPVAETATGDKDWDPCNLCAFKDACDSHENDFDRWFDEIRKISQQGE